MTSRILAAGVLAVGCLTAAAAGSYIAVRQNAVEVPEAAPSAPPVAAPTPPVNETEGVVAPPERLRDEPARPEAPVEIERPSKPSPPAVERRVFPRRAPAPKAVPVRASTTPEPIEAPPAVSEPASPGMSADVPGSNAPSEAPRAAPPAAEPLPPVLERAVEPELQQIVLPAASVIGLELETAITTERAQIEDRVDARVTRDVYADGRLAIPSGSRVIGSVTLVERGGKVKERARLGVRFHTLVIAGGRQVPLRTETIYREGESPANDSSRKIGGAAIGGAVLGAILGGKKGAIAGATAGAAGGTAVVMAGDRKAATLASGSVVTVKLSAPASYEVER